MYNNSVLPARSLTCLTAKNSSCACMELCVIALLHGSHRKYTDDDEIEKHASPSLAKIKSASKCLRVVGSIDQKIGQYAI
jgi:hypothetical protein